MIARNIDPGVTMRKNRRYPKAVVLVLLVLVLAGCGIKTEGLIPDQQTPASRQINKSVKVMPVEGGRASSFGREAYITNEQFFEALRRTMIDSRVFASVVESGDKADLNLYSEIITVTTEGGISPTYAIVVQYWLVDPATGRQVWRKGINTRHHVEWNEAFAGATRIIRAVEGATKKNLLRLVEELSSTPLT